MKRKNYLFIIALLISCFAFAQTGTEFSESFKCGDSIRKYTFYVPAIYNSSNASVPLIINMHGATGTSAKQKIAEDFRTIADTANFIIVHPQGLNIPLYPGVPSSQLNQTGWNVLGTVAAWQTDRDFIINLLDSMEVHYKINPSKVYLTGYSEGGFMSYDFACFVSGRFAAIASVSGSLVSAHYSACAPSQPVPVMEIHGTNDGIIGYTGTGLTSSTAVDTMINYWVKYNHCNPIPNSITHIADIADSCCVGDTVKVNAPVSHVNSSGVTVAVGDTISFVDNSKVVHYTYTGGTKGTTVELYKVLNGGHQIPASAPQPVGYGTGNTNADFTAAKEIWRFFSQYDLISLGITPVVGTTAPPTGIDNPIDNNSVSIYPNPSNGLFTLHIENYENTNIQLFNLLGTLLEEEKISEKDTPINLKTVLKGIYFYKITNKNTVVKTGKLLVQ